MQVRGLAHPRFEEYCQVIMREWVRIEFEIDQLELKRVLFDSSTNSVLHVLCCPKNVIKGCANSFMQPLTLTRPRLHKLALRGKREPDRVQI